MSKCVCKSDAILLRPCVCRTRTIPASMSTTGKAYTVVEPKPIESGAMKHDQGKPDFSMISYELMEMVARVRDFGKIKYSRNNWQKGFKVTRSCAAALRHIFLFLSGQTNDEESGLSHLGHAVCCLEHAIYDMKHHPHNDDRKDA